jgi:transposase-like protein
MLTTAAGDLDLRTPKVRVGSFFSAFPNPAVFERLTGAILAEHHGKWND